MVKPSVKAYILWIFQKIKRRFPLILALTLLSIAISLSGLCFVFFSKELVGSALAADLHRVRQAGAFMVGLALFQILGNLIMRFFATNLQEGLERDMKHSVLSTILRSEYSAISRHHSSDLIQRMDSDGGSILQGVMFLTTGLAGVITNLIGSAAALLMLAPGFTLVSAAILIAMSSSSLLFSDRLKELSIQTSEANGRVRGFLYEAISSLMVIQALDTIPEVERRSQRALERRWSVRRKWRSISILSRFGPESIDNLSYFLILVWSAWRMLSGRIAYEDVTLMLAMSARVRRAATVLTSVIPRWVSVTASCDRIMELEALPRQPDPDPAAARSLYETLTGFTAGHLTFAYDREPVLTDVSLTIPKGGLTVIIGQSGIGKSTLLKLLLGLYRPDSGSLSIDMPDGPIVIDRSTRSLFSYAPQGNFLLSGTLRENLTYTNPQATDEQIREALYASALDEFVAALPLGLGTVLLENGAGLSEGQAQRLSLARAILSGAPVLLLDEVTSALDEATEATVLERITALPGRTCIAVTHRPAALALATSIIEVTEEGMTLKTCE